MNFDEGLKLQGIFTVWHRCFYFSEEPEYVCLHAKSSHFNTSSLSHSIFCFLPCVHTFSSQQ